MVKDSGIVICLISSSGSCFTGSGLMNAPLRFGSFLERILLISSFVLLRYPPVLLFLSSFLRFLWREFFCSCLIPSKPLCAFSKRSNTRLLLPLPFPLRRLSPREFCPLLLPRRSLSFLSFRRPLLLPLFPRLSGREPLPFPFRRSLSFLSFLSLRP